jgi:ribosomal protein S18 acetylase RimI-like enzyme
MTHILDNPIYNALITNHQIFSEGDENVKYYHREVASFAGMKTYLNSDFQKLHKIMPDKGVFIVFSPDALEVPGYWNLIRKIEMFQFVYEHDLVPEFKNEVNLNDLNHQHVDEMIALVELTKPGPFLSKTINLSNYIGVFEEGRLVAMSGHRFHSGNYIEVSAVCAHPDFLGRGYAYAVIREQIKRILEKSQIPFLHVRQDNVAAVKLYEKLGFRIRTGMKAYVLAAQ